MKKQIIKKVLVGVLALSMLAVSAPFTAFAANYDIGSGSFVVHSDTSLTAKVSVTETVNSSGGTDEQHGLLLCLLDRAPEGTQAGQKVKNSGGIHPPRYDYCKYYFVVPGKQYVLTKGEVEATWAADAIDQKGSGKTLGEVLDEQDWHIVIGPRYYQTNWGDNGVGAGKDGIWEHCDFYVGQKSEVVDETAAHFYKGADVRGKLVGENPYIGKIKFDVTYDDFNYIYDLSSSTWTTAEKDFTITNNSEKTKYIEGYENSKIDIAYTPDTELAQLASGTVAIKTGTVAPASDKAPDYEIAKTYTYTLGIANTTGTEDAQKESANALARKRMNSDNFSKIGDLTIKYMTAN